MKPHDHALSLKGYENAAEAEAFDLEIGSLPPPSPPPSEGPRKPLAEESLKTIKGQTREGTIKSAIKGGKARQKKLRIDKSLAFAEERRERRRAALGVTIHYTYRAWSKLTKEKQEAFNAQKRGHALTTYPETGSRWDFLRDFGWDYSQKMDGGEHLNHLFRSGGAKR